MAEMKNLFEQLGFNTSEMRVYLNLAELGKASAKTLSLKSGLQRTTVYSVIENLIGKGVISKEESSDGSYFVLNSLDSLERMVEVERLALSRRSEAAKKLKDLIIPHIKSKNFSVPKLQFFEGSKNVREMLYKFEDDWQRSALRADATWWGYQDHTLVLEYSGWLEHYWKKMKSNERVLLLSNAASTQVEKIVGLKIKNRVIKPLPPGVDFSSSIWVVGEYIVMVVTRQKPHYAVQLKDPVFSGNLRTVFQMLWGEAAQTK